MILLIALLGSVVRIAFGYMHTPWIGAADQIAWEMVLSGTGISYDTMIHYPHEGGSILISAFSRFVKLFTDFNSLTVSAVVLDFISRFTQLFVVFKLFKRPVFLLFAGFTIFSIPAIVPFGTVNFGLHSISSCFPFILMYLIWRKPSNQRQYAWYGAILGCILWFSYINIVLVPIFFLHMILSKEKMRHIMYSLGSFILVMALHVSVRYFADAGFHLHEFGIASIRGEGFLLGDSDTWTHLYQFWFGPFSDSMIANPEAGESLIKLSELAVGIIVIGMLLSSYFLIKTKKCNDNPFVSSGLFIVLSFVCLYSVSPFYFDNPSISNYVLYRHLTYIFPLAVTLSFWGFSKVKWGNFISPGIIITGIISTVFLFQSFPKPNDDKMVVGWVLGFKYGHDPDKLYQIIESSEDQHQQLYKGSGWGIASALFQDIDHSNHTLIASKIEQIHICLEALPDEQDRQSFMQGVHFAFEPYLEPKLDSEIFEQIADSFKQASTEK